MKKFILITILFSCVAGFAQLTLKRADKYYDQLDFEKAAYYYKAFLYNKEDAYSQLQLAKIYTQLNNNEEAAKWYEELMHREDLEAVHYLNYAQTLSALGKYEEAIPFYEKYKDKADDKLLAKEKTYGLEHIEDFYADSALSTIKLADFNSEEMDFSPSFYGDEIVFASGRENYFGLQRRFGLDNKGFLDLYITEGQTVKKFDSKINSKFHEGAVTFSPDGNTAYFTRNNFVKGKYGKNSKTGVNMIKLYQATKDSHGKWSNIEEFKYNSNDYSTGDASITADGQILYFISDMPGGFGGTDLYKCYKTESGWGEPKNLGHKVNSEANERTPYLTEEGKLYFASEGHFGLGGLDIYEAEAHNGNYDELRNLGYPINSTGDDFGLIFNKETREGYFSSDREGGYGADDIYWVNIKEDPKVMLTGKVFAKTEGQSNSQKQPLGSSLLTIVNKSTGATSSQMSTEDGSYSLKLKPGFKYEVTASKDTLQNDRATFDLTDKKKKEYTPVDMMLVRKLPTPTTVNVSGVVTDGNSSKGLGSTPIYLLNTKTKEVTYVQTDANGNYDLILDPNTDYVMKTASNGYLINCASFRTPSASRENHKLTNALSLSKLEVNTKLEVENLYYDLGKYDIKPESAIELDKIVQFLKDNEGIVVELGAHTDARGSFSGNSSLSGKRAKAARDYIVSHGISSSNITYKGYGETQIINRCSDGVSCSELEHSVNRRTEIKITEVKKGADAASLLTKGNAFNADADYAGCKTTRVVKK